MKKIFPLIVAIVVFSAFLIGQILFEEYNPSAKLSSKEESMYAYVAQELKTLKVKTTKGEEITFNQTPTVVILNFWASWCQPCLEEFPDMTELARMYGGNQLLILGINSDEDDQDKKIQEIVAKYNLNFPIAADKNGVILNKFLISSLPVSIVYVNGKTHKIYNGKIPFEKEKFVNFIRDTLKNENSDKI